MENARNITVYRYWSPLYDAVFGPLFVRARHRAIAALNLQAGERLLLPGVGTGLDLPHLPLGVNVLAGDLSASMLGQAVSKTRAGQSLHQQDAQHLPLPDAVCEAALLSLILSVVPNGEQAFAEAWRVLKPGGCLVIFDKFLPETARLSPPRRLLGRLTRTFGTDVNRRLSDVLVKQAVKAIELDEPLFLRGQYRLIRLRKP